MGIWIELGVFLLVFVFAAWQFHDLKKAKAERIARERMQQGTQGRVEPGRDGDGGPGSSS